MASQLTLPNQPDADPYWRQASLIGTLLTLTLFQLLPLLTQDIKPIPQPVIMELDFMEWQPPAKPSPPIPQPQSRPKPPPVKKVEPRPAEKTTPKPAPSEPKPVLTDKLDPEPTPPTITEETPPPASMPETQPQANDDSEPSLPTPAPIFEITQLPRFLHKQAPVYPASMKNIGREATVKLEILIDAKGNVRRIEVTQSAGPEFDQAAIEAINNSRFQAANIQGKAVAVIWKIPVKFKLQ